MKKLTNIIVFITLLVITACTDESKFNSPAPFDLESGSFIRFENNKPNLTYLDAQNISFSDVIYDSSNNTQSYSLSLTATIGGETLNEVIYFATTSFPSTLEITSQKIADALNIDVNTISFGDNFDFKATAIRNDGEVFTEDNTNFELLNGVAYKDAMAFTLIISCPFDQDEIIGEYEVVADDVWGDYLPGDRLTVIAGDTEDTYRILINNNFFITNNSDDLWIEVTVNLNTGASTAISNDTLNYEDWLSLTAKADEGLTLSCVGNITLNLDYVLEDGRGFFDNPIEIQKIQ